MKSIRLAHRKGIRARGKVAPVAGCRHAWMPVAHGPCSRMYPARHCRCGAVLVDVVLAG